jgi:hypothetical protein
LEKLFYSAGHAQTEAPTKRERYTLRIVFDVKGPEAKTQNVNPLGLSISSVREDAYINNVVGVATN